MFGVSGLKIERLRQASASSSRVATSYGVWSVVWVVAHCIGGAVIGALLGTVGARLSLTAQIWTWIVAAVLLLGGLHHLGLFRVPMPQMHRQVPRHWMFRCSLTWVAVGYGVQLGSAVATRITNFATYAVLAAAMSTGSPVLGGLTMMVFGFARALPAVLVGPFAYPPNRSLALAVRLEAWEERVHRASGVALLLAAVILQITNWRPI